MKKQIIAATAIAATGLVSTIGTAHADTTKIPLPTDAKNEPALVEKSEPKKVEVKTPTKEEVAELDASATKAQEEETKAKEVLDQANEKSDKAEKKVTDLKQNQADAQKTADKATPEAIQNAEKKVETAKASVPTKAQAVSTAQTEKDDADREVAVHGKTVGTKQAEVTQAKTTVATAKTEVENAQKALNGEGLADAKNKQADAIKEEATSKQAQEMAQNVLDEAKAQNQNHVAQLKQAETQVATAKTTLENKTQEKQSAKEKADTATANYNQAVSTLNALQKEDAKATITLAPDFIKAVKENMAYTEDLRNGTTLTSEEQSAKTLELYNKIVESQLQNPTLNKYTPSAKDQADETRYDINNLPKEVTDELNYFVADLINQMRRQLGLPDVVLSKSSLEFANKIAKEYVKANFSTAMKDEYRAKGGAGHYAKGIYKVAKEYGLNSTYTEEENQENAEKGLQPYENAVTTPVYHDFDDEDGVYRKTLGEMKEKLYGDLIELISHKNDYAHTQGILQFDYANETVYFGGVAQSKTDEFYTTHFLTSIRTTNVDGSKWDKTPIVNPLSNTNKEQEIAKARQTLADAMVARKDTQDKLEATSKAVSDAQTALQNAQAHLSALNNGENPLANAQNVFNEAKVRHDKAVVTLANANALVNSLTASKATKEETLKHAQATLIDAEKALKQAQDELKAEETKMAELEAVASNKSQAVSTAKKALQDAKDTVKQAEKELADLKGAKARLVELKAQLEKAQAELKDVYKAQNQAKADYEVKSLAAAQAKIAYETAKAKYEEAETKRLVAQADAKRKELEHLGYKPVPVVDGKGNVVDYKLPQETVTVNNGSANKPQAQATVGKTTTTAKASTQATLPNTGEGTSALGILGVLGFAFGLVGFKSRKEN